MSDTGTPAPIDNLAQLRERAEQAATLEAENRRLQARLAVGESGFNGSDPLVAHLMEGYKGEPTKDAVTSFLTGLGLSPQMSQHAATQTEGQDASEVLTFDTSTTEARQGLSAGSQPPAAQQRIRENPYEVALLNKMEGIQRGDDPDDLLADGVKVVMGAAALNDQRVLVKHSENAQTPYGAAQTRPRL